MITMYPGKVNSPATTLSASITDIVTTIPLTDASVLPDAPNLAVIGTDEDCETILYAAKAGNDLTGCTREFQGVKKAWAVGTSVARMFTAYDYDTLRTNLTTHDVATTGVHGAGAGTVACLTAAGALTVSELTLTPKVSSTGTEGTIFYCSDDNSVYVGTE